MKRYTLFKAELVLLAIQGAILYNAPDSFICWFFAGVTLASAIFVGITA